MGNGTLTWGTDPGPARASELDGDGLLGGRTSPADVRVRALLERNFVFVWRLLRRLGVSESEVDDAVQQVFIVAARKRDRIAATSERSFLFGTALRVAAACRRQKRHTSDTGEEVSAVADAGPLPDEVVARRQAMAVLDAIVESMPEELRVVFILCELEEVPVTEVANLQRIPAGTVASRLRRARREFQEGAKRALIRAKSGGRQP
jgi:RNA polymerase sigma-70 factor (ECF subfamily)